MQAGTSFTSACVAVMWHIPLPNSSPTFDLSAIFLSREIDDIFVCAADAKCSDCLCVCIRNFARWCKDTFKVRWEIYNWFCCKCIAEFNSKRMVKIGRSYAYD